MFERNLLVPRNVEGRKEKKLQLINRQLQQEVVDGDLEIFNTPITNLGNVKVVYGNLDLEGNKTLKSLGNIESVNDIVRLSNNTKVPEEQYKKFNYEFSNM